MRPRSVQPKNAEPTPSLPTLLPQQSTPTHFELLDAAQLAERLNLPETWIREQSRSRTQDKIPHVKFGKHCRYEFRSPSLEAWISRRRKGSVEQ